MYISTTNNSSHFIFKVDSIKEVNDYISVHSGDASLKFNCNHVDDVKFLNEFGNETNITDIQRLIQVNEEIKLHVRQWHSTKHEAFKIDAELVIEVKDVIKGDIKSRP